MNNEKFKNELKEELNHKPSNLQNSNWTKMLDHYPLHSDHNILTGAIWSNSYICTANRNPIGYK